MSSSYFCEGNTVLSEGFLGPPARPSARRWRPREVEGSLFITVKEAAERHLREGGDWRWLNCRATGEVLTSREGLQLAKK